MTDAKLKTFAGWTQGSRMTGVYVHLAGEDLDKTFMEMHGLAEKTIPQETPLKPRVCVRGHGNPGEAAYCLVCGIILDEEKASEIMTQSEHILELRRKIEEYEQRLSQVEFMADPDKVRDLIEAAKLYKELLKRQGSE